MWRKAHPFLIFVVNTRIDVVCNSIVHSAADGKHVVREIGATIAGIGQEVEDASAVHGLSIRHETPISAMIASAYLVCLFIKACLSIFDEMEFTLNADIVEKVIIEIDGASIDAAGKIIRVCRAEAASNLKIAGSLCGWSCLSVQCSRSTGETNKYKNPGQQVLPLKNMGLWLAVAYCCRDVEI